MLPRRRRIFWLGLVAADLVALWLAYVLAFKLRFPDLPLSGYSAAHGAANRLILLTGLVTWPVLLQIFGLYEPARLRRRWRMWSGLLPAALLLGVVLGAVLFFAQAKLASRLVLVAFLGVSTVLLWADRLAAGRLLRWWGETASPWLLIVGAGEAAASFGHRVAEAPELGTRLAGYVHAGHEPAVVSGDAVLGDVHDLARILEERVVDQVAIALPSATAAEIEAIEATCAELGRDVLVVDSELRALLARATIDRMGGLQVLRLHGSPQFRDAMPLKRAVDVVASAVLLVAASPLLLVCGLLVKLTSPGPVLYVQERVGLNGRRFRLLKLRSMVEGADRLRAELEPHNEASGPHFKIAKDPRVTPVGRFLRRFSLDELPQLVNVLKGDMSLVGPRPPLPDEVARYDRWQRRRLSVRPGMTGPWQVSGRSDLDFTSLLALDLAYIDGWSPWRDLVILARTVPAVLSGRGAR